MHTADLITIFTSLFSELIDGRGGRGGNVVLNPGDGGLLGSLDRLSAAEASQSVNDGATIAAHAQHVRYGLSLMNRWASEGGNPFADATWDQAWKTTAVDADAWQAIQNGLHDETDRWLKMLGTPRQITGVELTGMLGSIVHLAYHLGAIRQIATSARGPKQPDRS